MARMTINEKVAALSDDLRNQLVQAALDGESITDMSRRLKLEYPVVQTCL